MQTDLAKMRELLVAGAVRYNGAQHAHFHLAEAGSAAKLRSVTVEMGKGDWFLFTPDAGRGRAAQLSPLMASAKGHFHHCVCDAVVVSLVEAVLSLLYLELKSDRPTHYEQQFRSTACLMAYWREVARRCYDIAVPKVRERFVALCTRAQRQPTRLRTPTNPQEPWQIPVQDGGRLRRDELPLT